MSESVETPESQLGQVLDGRYRLESVIGEGGFGVVFKATQISTQQVVAVKVLHAELLEDTNSSEEYIKRFEREMTVIGQLKHPNLVRLLDEGKDANGALFMVLEYIEGKPLNEVIRKEGRLSLPETLHLMNQVLDALHAAHKHGIVHRDLKPHNIMLTSTGYRRNAMVLDFGIAAVLEGQRSENYKSLTRASDIRGTPSYMAPEQIQDKKLTPQSDIYAWGLTFIECIAGRPAVTGSNPFEIAISQVSNDEVEVPAGLLTPDLEEIILGCVAKPLNKRFKNAVEVFERLDRCRIAQLATTVAGDDASQTQPISANEANRLLALRNGSTPSGSANPTTESGRSKGNISEAPTAIFNDAAPIPPKAEPVPARLVVTQPSEKIIVDDPALAPATRGSSKLLWVILAVVIVFAIANYFAWQFLLQKP